MALATVNGGSSGAFIPSGLEGGRLHPLAHRPLRRTSTLSRALRPALEGERPVEILDGDEVRTYLSAGLGFSRRTATRTSAGSASARLLARNGTAAVTAAISPCAGTRDEVRSLAERDSVPFVEVHVAAPVAALAGRDVKGALPPRGALAGEITRFTGVSDPYEPPAPGRRRAHGRGDRRESAGKILEHLQRGLLRVAGVEVATS